MPFTRLRTKKLIDPKQSFNSKTKDQSISQAIQKVSKSQKKTGIHRPSTYVIGISMVGSNVTDGRPTLILPRLLPFALAELPLLFVVSRGSERV
jgi:hypothetical protein